MISLLTTIFADRYSLIYSQPFKIQNKNYRTILDCIKTSVPMRKIGVI